MEQAQIAMSWYAGWNMYNFPPSALSWQKYNILAYAFALTTPDPASVEFAMGEEDERLFPTFIDLAHQHDVKALISVGGWTGSRFFSSAVATEESRSTFAETLVSFLDDYGFDGIDFDWEYPGVQGIGCNEVSESDTSNFLSFLQLLRSRTSSHTPRPLFTAAVGPRPWPNHGNLSDFTPHLDLIAIMNYDLYSPAADDATYIGPNAPIDDSCAPESVRHGSATQAVRDWSTAGIPAERLLLGVPAYGHAYRVRMEDLQASNEGSQESSTTFNAFAVFDGDDRPNNEDGIEDAGGTDLCGNWSPSGGYIEFQALVANGYLNETGHPTSDMTRFWDDCSQTPFVYKPDTEVIISYDDAQSFEIKGEFIKANGLAGFAMWDAAGDRDDLLLDGIHGGMNSQQTISDDPENHYTGVGTSTSGVSVGTSTTGISETNQPSSATSLIESWVYSSVWGMMGSTLLVSLVSLRLT